MNYNRFSAQVKMITILPEKERKRRGLDSCWIQIELFADGKPMNDSRNRNVYLWELEKSLLKSGEYWVFCCSCGYAYCPATDDHIVLIHHGKDYIEWTNGENLPHAHYYFKKEQYARVVKQLKEDLYSFFSHFEGKYDGYVLRGNDGRTIDVYPNDLLEDWAKEVNYWEKL